MKEDRSWRPLVAIFLGSIVIAWAWSTADESACSLAMRIVVADDPKKTIGSCLEFWINRYQTLFGAAAALFAAWYAGRWVQHQLRVTERQLNAARIPLYDTQIAGLGEQKDCLHAFEESFEQLHPNRLIVEGFRTFDDALRMATSNRQPVSTSDADRLVEEARERLGKFERAALLRPGSPELQEAQRKFAKAAYGFLDEWRRVTRSTGQGDLFSFRLPGLDTRRDARMTVYGTTRSNLHSVQLLLDNEYGAICRIRNELQQEVHGT